MLRQLGHGNDLDMHLSGAWSFAPASRMRPAAVRMQASAPPRVVGMPARPDATAVSPSIPLFYIGRNSKGAWVVCAADGQSGGLFVLKQSAARFARRQCASAGCAVMYLTGPLELGIGSDGKGTPVSVQSGAVPFATIAIGLVDRIVRAWRRCIDTASRRFASVRRNRAAIERDLFHGQYTLSSKNDDDLPIVR